MCFRTVLKRATKLLATAFSLAASMAQGAAPTSKVAAAFRDVSVERRCSALSGYLRNYVGEHLLPLTFKDLGCGEGNGLGGERYTVDFLLTGVKGEGKRFRLAVAYGDDRASSSASAVFCDLVSTSPTCEAGSQLSLGSLNPNATAMIDAVTNWVKAPPTLHLIYALPYDEFLKKMVAYRGSYPVTHDEETKDVAFTLVPTASGHPEQGKVAFAGPMDADLLSCFHCTSSKCMAGVTYRFDDRYLALDRTAEKGEHFGASWIITGPMPRGEGEAQWKYACGISRYSLETLTY